VSKKYALFLSGYIVCGKIPLLYQSGGENPGIVTVYLASAANESFELLNIAPLVTNALLPLPECLQALRNRV